jgi:hypothetical protein
MKSQEEIENKIKSMKEGLSMYVENWNNSIKCDSINGLPIQLIQDVNYNVIKNQIEALEWVLKDK